MFVLCTPEVETVMRRQLTLFSLLFGLLVFWGGQPSALAAPKKALTKEEKARFNDATTQAASFFKTQEFEKAIEKYKEAYAIDEEPLLLLAMGQCYRKLERYKEAISSYELFLAAQPSSPDRKSIEESIKALKILQAQGSLDLSTDNDPAQLYFDGELKGETPLVVTGITPGVHSIEVKKKGFLDYKKELTFNPSQQKLLDLVLEKLPGSLSVSSSQDPMGVEVDGVLLGVSPLTQKLSPGTHQLAIRKEGHQTLKETITILPGEELALTPKLSIATGSYLVRTNLNGAQVFLDGESQGKTNKDGTLILSNVPAGLHEIKVVLRPYPSEETKYPAIEGTQQEVQLYSVFRVPKVLYSVAATTFVSGLALGALGIGVGELGDQLENEFLTGQPAQTLGGALLGTALVSGSFGVVLSIRQGTKKITREESKELKKSTKELKKEAKDKE